MLWVFGMAVAAFSGGSFRFNYSGGGEGDTGSFKLPKTPPIEKLPSETNKVLGTYTDSILELFSNIPLWVWIVLAVSLLLVVLVAIAIALFVRNWAKGALIASIHDREDRKAITLRSGSLWGLSLVKRFIILHILPWLLLAGAILILLIPTIASLALTESETVRTIAIIFFVLITLGIGLIGGVMAMLTIILAEQLVVRENLSAKAALKKGFQLSKKHLRQLISMGAINLGIGCAFGCATAIVILLLIAIVILAFVINKEAGYIAAVIVGIPILTLILLSVLIRGIYTVFNTSTWTLLAREIENQEQEGAQNA